MVGEADVTCNEGPGERGVLKGYGRLLTSLECSLGSWKERE